MKLLAEYQEFLFGLLAGFAGFLLQDRVSTLIAARRFRQRIACDIELQTRNYMNHLPELKDQIAGAKALINRGEVPDDISAYPVIWSNEFSLLSHLLENSAHLRLGVFNACVEFYDIMGRLEKIRNAYNDSARHLATSSQERPAHFRFLYHCLNQQMKEYVYVVEKGGHALRSLSRAYGHVHVDGKLLDQIFDPA